MSAEPRILDLGAGRDRSRRGAVTVDRVASAGPDVVHDLDVVPWPFDRDSFDVIICKDVIEHVADVVKTMEEIHRVGRAGARVEIATPHYSCRNSWTDPTHRQHLGYFSFDYFTSAIQWDYYTAARFKLIDRRLRCRDTLKGRVVEQIANRWPAFYEEHLAWIVPAFFLWVVLEVSKDPA